MILFPAIDLKDGECVRLVHGLMDQATVFNDNPAAQARAFEDAGFEYIHLVDLNGAFEGRPVNAGAVESILGEISIPAQLGGGIRDLATIEMWLEKGIRRVIIGTAAVKNPDLVIEACRKFPGRIAVGLVRLAPQFLLAPRLLLALAGLRGAGHVERGVVAARRRVRLGLRHRAWRPISFARSRRSAW